MQVHIERVDETGSTNADLLEAARRGAPSGTVLVADRQHAGRGRLGRAWEAPAGGSLLLSILVRPDLRNERLHVLTQWMALAAVDACTEVTGVTPDLKWPNDLLVDGRKLAGILAEVVADGDRVAAVVVGIGLNVNWPDPLPEHLADSATALNLLTGHPVDREALLQALVRRLGHGIDADAISAAYRARLATVGQRVRVELPDRTIEGTAVDVLDDGRLIVEHDHHRTVVAVGDVIHLRRR